MSFITDTNEAPQALVGVQRVKLRLTKRGKAFFGLLAVVMVFISGYFVSLVNSSAASATASTTQAEFGYVVPMPGESLWEIAVEIAPDVDPRDTVAAIVRLNQLSSSAINEHEPLAVPHGYATASRVFSAAEVGLTTNNMKSHD